MYIYAYDIWQELQKDCLNSFTEGHHNFIQRQKQNWKAFVKTLPGDYLVKLDVELCSWGQLFQRRTALTIFLHATSKNPLSAFTSRAYSSTSQQRALWDNNLIIYAASISVVIWGWLGISELWRWETVKHMPPRKDQWNGGGRRQTEEWVLRWSWPDWVPRIPLTLWVLTQ